MTDIAQAIVLAVIQGITEFLPISSSAHIILLTKLFSWKDFGLSFDIAVHGGTLVSILWFFKKEVSSICIDCYNLLLSFLLKNYKHKPNIYTNLCIEIIIATIPIVLCGLIAKDLNLRGINIIIYTTIIFGFLLYIADYYGSLKRKNNNIKKTSSINKTSNRNKNNIKVGFKYAFIIGLAQCLAIIPGVSRSGITITAALLLGINRADSARFSFLIAIPTISLACLYNLYTLTKQVQVFNLNILVIGFVISALVGCLSISFFIKLLDKVSMLPFAVYRVILGVILILAFC